jgi:hypothetical protein
MAKTADAHTDFVINYAAAKRITFDIKIDRRGYSLIILLNIQAISAPKFDDICSSEGNVRSYIETICLQNLKYESRTIFACWD